MCSFRIDICMDDLLVIHNTSDQAIENYLQQTYQGAIEFKKTHLSEHNSNYLDLTIDIKDNRIKTALYNKRDDFNFKVIKFHAITLTFLFSIKSQSYTQSLYV